MQSLELRLSLLEARYSLSEVCDDPVTRERNAELRSSIRSELEQIERLLRKNRQTSIQTMDDRCVSNIESKSGALTQEDYLHEIDKNKTYINSPQMELAFQSTNQLDRLEQTSAECQLALDELTCKLHSLTSRYSNTMQLISYKYMVLNRLKDKKS